VDVFGVGWPPMVLFLKSYLQGFHFVAKIFVLIYFLLALILVLISMVFGFKVDNFVNHYSVW